jgi:dTDP-glucose 4,6-dehydratase
MNMKLMITGGAGFIGSHFVKYILEKYPTYHILNVDKMTYAGNLDNLNTVDGNDHYRFIKADIADTELMESLAKEVDIIVNFAAETHVDRSIHNPFDFIDTDVRGTFSLIQASKNAGHKKYVQISTDEVYGDFDDGGKAIEDSPLRPSSPYAASKAGGDLQVLAAHRTYGFPGMVTRCTNNYGPNCYPEKMIPLFITNAIEGAKLPIYGDGMQVRDWLYVYDHCSAIDLVLHEGKPGEIYNIGADNAPEVTNLDLTKQMLALLNLDDSLIDYVTDRPGHDRRYAVDSSKIRSMGWKPSVTFEEGLAKTVDWYKTNEIWWKKIKSGEYLDWYKKQYER